MNDKSFIRGLELEDSKVLPKGPDPKPVSFESFAQNIILGAVFVAALLALILGPTWKYSYSYWTAYNDPELSKIASDYGNAILENRLAKRFPDLDDVQLIGIKKDFSSGWRVQSDYEISYREGDEIYEFTVSGYRSDYQQSVAWIDMSEPEEIRVQFDDSDTVEHRVLRTYSDIVKSIFDASARLVEEHIADRREWKNTFKEPNLSGE